jgi:hypothetical protein
MAELLDPTDLISVFDAALLWFDKDPRESFSSYGLHGWIIPLTRDHEVFSLAYDILSEIERGTMHAPRSARLLGIPDFWKSKLADLPGNRDPRYTMVTAATLAQFAVKRGENPHFLSHLIENLTTHIGASDRRTASKELIPGASVKARVRGRRPTKRQMVEQAMRRDIQDGRVTRADLDKMLEKQLAETYSVSRDTARKARAAVLSTDNPNRDK